MISSSPTFDVGSSRLNNALAEAKSLVESLPGSLRTKAIQNLEQGNFTANTVGSGSVRNSVPVRFCGGEPC